MPVYEVPNEETESGATAPEDGDTAHDEADPAAFRYHHRGPLTYVASNVEIPVYEERADDADDAVRTLGATEMSEFPAPETSSGGGESESEDSED